MYLRADTIEPAFAIVTFEAPEGPAADSSIQNGSGRLLRRWHRIENRCKLGMDGDRERRAGLRLLDVPDMLPPHDDIAAPLRSVEPERESPPFTASDGMMRLKLCNLLFGPRREAVAYHAAKLDAERGIIVEQVALDAVLRQRADGGEPIFRRGRLHRVEQGAQKLGRHGAHEFVAVLAVEPFQRVLNSASPEPYARYVTAFRQGLS